MATNALIGYINGDSVRSVYCHWDGYPGWVGKHLRDGFNHHELIVDLIEQGEIRSIHPKADGSGYEVDRRHRFYDHLAADGPTCECHLSEFVPSRTLGEWLYLWDGDVWWCMSHKLPMMMKLEDAIKWQEEAQ